ncbi:dihydrodipicolinate synthase family protein [Arhodomonas sp. SL1]|uniref:dihydrodipicolinate synthase family protein n=1 Tax=Arhodomonas sp. SL1 TaxID=3425691 RepID=UPI003F880EB7
MFTGLSAFPLTPMNEAAIDDAAFIRLVERLAAAGVDSIGGLGSTGNYAYLTPAERRHVGRLAVEHAGDIPVIIGISALRTRDVLALAEDAQSIGASAVLLAPMSYQPLSEAEVFGLYQAVTTHLSVPLCVYDNPRTTHFQFSDALYERIAALPNVASIKIPGVPEGTVAARERIERLRARLGPRITLGVSGDPMAARGLNAGCDAWYSVIGGLFPETALRITRAAQAGEADRAIAMCEHLQPLWTQFERHGGGLRVVATAAELLGLAGSPCLPRPLMALEGDERNTLAELLDQLRLA